LAIGFGIPVEKMIIIGSWGRLLILAIPLHVFCFFWLRQVLILKKTVYKVALHSDDQILLKLHFNQTIVISKEDIVYVTPYVPLTVKEVMTETANTRNREYVIKLNDGTQYRVPYTMDDLEILLKLLSGEVGIHETTYSHHDEETVEMMVNNSIYAVCIVIGLILVGGLLALTLLSFIESNYGKESAASFTVLVWLPLVIVFGPLVGMLLGYFVVKYRSGKDKALNVLIGK